MTAGRAYTGLVRISLAVLAAAAALAAAPARADRVQVFSIQGADCGDRASEIKNELKKVKGVKKAEFDIHKVELTVKLADGVPDADVVAAVERAKLKAIVGPGQGAYLPHPAYPPGADVATLTQHGAAVGPLDKLRVTGKYTVFDIYADWCGPCRTVDERLRALTAERPDLAVRKLNVVDFDTPLAREMGARLEALPYVVVFSPSGKRTDIEGVAFDKLEKALSQP
jgi:thiol-disulfide isomerase/thioredoxin/copper chaperone CopZ